MSPVGARLSVTLFENALRTMPTAPVDLRSADVERLCEEAGGGAVNGFVTWAAFARLYLATSFEAAS